MYKNMTRPAARQNLARVIILREKCHSWRLASLQGHGFKLAYPQHHDIH